MPGGDETPGEASSLESEVSAMPEGWLESRIPGVLRRQLQTHADERGAFTELWRARWTAELCGRPFVQANLSRSRRDVLRGMHFHRRQSDLWVVVEGRALVAVADLRELAVDVSRAPAVDTFEVGGGAALFIPELVAHGFLALSELALVYLVSNEYDGTDELGFAWDDPVAAIPWTTRGPVLSARDRSNPSLRDALTPPRGA